ncbi:MAG: N-acetylmuramoyl-L-alanine amidase [Candidatus Hydrogenedentota bacterium]
MNKSRAFISLGIIAVICVQSTYAGVVKRREIEPGVLALSKDGGNLGLEVHLPGGNGAKRILAKYLANPDEWVKYKNRLNCFVPFDQLRPEYRRKALLTIFSDDVIDGNGWTHTAIFDGETLWNLSHWTTNNGANRKYAVPLSGDQLTATLRRGQKIRIPVKFLTKVMRAPTLRVIVEPTPELAGLNDSLLYRNDKKGTVAVYRLKRGESLYSSVVMRFTDYAENADVLQACKEVAARSGIRDMRDIDAGQSIYIPVNMLSDQYQPTGTKARVAYEDSIKESKRLQNIVVASKDLSGIVVILDPGHGGKDYGAYYPGSGLYEDEINYDIVMRIKKILESETSAKVHLTMIDRSAGLAASDRNRFSHDLDEELLTHPRHRNDVSSKVSANLRWMLINKLYDAERKRGVPARNILFTSIHTDSIGNGSHRGTMIYIPGAQYRSQEQQPGKIYRGYEEGRTHYAFASTASERRTDEALSRNFANVVMEELGKKRIKRYAGGSAIRNKIQRSRTSKYVPAVLRNTKVPTKILIETANLQNVTDRARLADPWWRQEFAKAYVAALKRFYGGKPTSSVALAD